MRTLIGWMAAMLASALLGAVVYENVLSKPVPASEQTATVETVPEVPLPTPTVYRTEVRTVVEPTPTATVVDEVVVRDVVSVSQQRTTARKPTRTAEPKPRATSSREEDDAPASSDDSETETGEHTAEDSPESDG
jgi:hypothetical protein